LKLRLAGPVEDIAEFRGSAERKRPGLFESLGDFRIGTVGRVQRQHVIKVLSQGLERLLDVIEVPFRAVVPHVDLVVSQVAKIMKT